MTPLPKPVETARDIRGRSATGREGALSRVLDRTAEGLQFLCTVIGMPILAVTITIDVAARYLLRNPFSWSNELDQTLLLLILIGCLPYCTLVSGHVHMDVIYDRLPRPWKLLVNIIWSLSGLVFFFGLAYACLSDLPYFWRIEKATAYLQLPWWVLYGFCGVCGLLAGLLLLRDPSKGYSVAGLDAPSKEQEGI